IYSAARLWDRAIRESRAAVETNPEDSSLLVELGSVLLKAGNAAEAEEPLRQAGELNPRDARTPYLLGQALAQLHRPEEARAAFGRFMAVAPSSFSAQVSEARAWLDNHP
ncbi:MAG: tetratricopeptide repeat protein, partial [Gemmatimonadales bacterium]